MVFGKSIFQSVLDRLDTENQQDEGDEAAAFRMAGLNTGFVVEGIGHSTPVACQPDAAYLAFAADPASEAITPFGPPQIPAHLARLKPEEIADELKISNADTIHSLSEKRRAFARTNHPDGVSVEFRANATQRMTIANQLIDVEIRRLALLRGN